MDFITKNKFLLYYFNVSISRRNLNSKLLVIYHVPAYPFSSRLYTIFRFFFIMALPSEISTKCRTIPCFIAIAFAQSKFEFSSDSDYSFPPDAPHAVRNTTLSFSPFPQISAATLSHPCTVFVCRHVETTHASISLVRRTTYVDDQCIARGRNVKLRLENFCLLSE